jgi:hypothetical protein
MGERQVEQSAQYLAEAALIHASACHASTFHGDGYRAAERRVIAISDELITRAVHEQQP